MEVISLADLYPYSSRIDQAQRRAVAVGQRFAGHIQHQQHARSTQILNAEYSYHLSAQSKRTALAVFNGFTISSRWPKRKPPQFVRDDQHWTHFIREFWVSCGNLRSSARRTIAASPPARGPSIGRLPDRARDGVVPHQPETELIGFVARQQEFRACCRAPADPRRKQRRQQENGGDS